MTIAPAARQAMDHLLFLGHQRIAMLEAYDPTQPSLPPTRSTAYSEALLERGLPVDPGLILAASWSGENGAALMAQVLSLAEPPTAVFAHSDEVALGALRTIRRSGLRARHRHLGDRDRWPPPRRANGPDHRSPRSRVRV